LFSFAFKSSPLLQPSNSEPSIIHHHFPSPQKPSDRESVYNIYQTHSRINSEGEVWLICIPLQLEEASKGIALIPNLRFINFFFLSFLNIWDHAIPLDSSFGGFYYFSCFSWTTTTSSPTNCILHIKHSATIPVSPCYQSSYCSLALTKPLSFAFLHILRCHMIYAVDLILCLSSLFHSISELHFFSRTTPP